MVQEFLTISLDFTVCNIIRIYSKVEDYKIKNKTRVDTKYK